MTGRLSLCYLLDGTALSGGAKVVLHHANLLGARGHAVTVVSDGPRPEWYRLRVGFRQVAWKDGEPLPAADVTVATYWTTLQTVAGLTDCQPLHFCQGYEGSFPHTAGDHAAIETAYRRQIPAITVTPHLRTLLAQRFGRPARVVTPALERAWRPAFRLGPSRTPRILVPGVFEAEIKGVRTGLDAVGLLRQRGIRCELVRLSTWPLSEEEKALTKPEEFHFAVPPASVPALVRGCDLALIPSSAVEGFGLPVVEAMASGVPVVASQIPSFSFITSGAAALVPFDDAGAFAAAAEELLSSPRRWKAARRRGREASQRFGEAAVGRALVDAFEWAASGAWRQEPVEGKEQGPGALGRRGAG